MRVEAAAKRICEGLEFLCANPAAKLEECRAHSALFDVRAFVIFNKDTTKVSGKRASADLVREVYPELTDTEVAQALSLLSDDKGLHSALLGELPRIRNLVEMIEKKQSPSAVLAALKIVLFSLSKRLDVSNLLLKVYSAARDASNYSVKISGPMGLPGGGLSTGIEFTVTDSNIKALEAFALGESKSTTHPKN